MTFCSRSKLLLSGAALGVLLMLVAPPPTSAASWGCLAQGATTNVIGISFSLAELIQADTDDKGNVISGTIFFASAAEACIFPITGGSFTIGGSGVGTVSFNLTIPALDLDGDLSCNRFFPALDPSDTSVTENYNVVLANGKKQMSFSSADDFLSGASPVPLGADAGDFVALTGQCLRQ